MSCPRLITDGPEYVSLFINTVIYEEQRTHLIAVKINLYSNKIHGTEELKETVIPAETKPK
jgi:hypothetical protein